MRKKDSSVKESVHNYETKSLLASHEEAILNDINKNNQKKGPDEKREEHGNEHNTEINEQTTKEGPPPEETTEIEETTTTTTTTKIFECFAIIKGPDCACVDEVHTYWIESPPCPGGTCDDWKIDKPSKARIIDVQGCTIKVLILDVGEFKVTAKYHFFGQTMAVLKKTDAYKVEHVRGGTNDDLIKTVPLVQPHPFVQISVPPATNGNCLPSSLYKIHTDKLQAGYLLLQADTIKLEKFIKDYFEVEIKLKGTISDFFVETVAVKWKINNKPEVSLVKNVEFTDTTFETRIPGEQGYDNRVVLLKGLGSSTVKIIAENTIRRTGTDWVDVYVTLTQNGWERIARLKDELAVLIYNSMTNPHAGHASAILNKRNEIKAAYFDELHNVCIECTYNHQESQSFDLPTRCKTRTKVRADKQDPMIVGNVMTSYPGGLDLHIEELKKHGATEYLTHNPVEEYWVTKYFYSGTEFNWDEDGMLRGERGEMLTSTYECCSEAIPVFGVEIIGEDCFEIKKNESITLQAEGLPPNADGGPGMYSWTVIAKPNATAQVTFSPAGWNASPTVQMKVDTSGIYTVKVFYKLGGRDCPLTYAIKDIKVFFKVAEELTWKLRRIGNYHAGVSAHVDRPYYQERKQGLIRAAEMLIEPGQAGTVIGKKFSGSFVIPLELAFSEDLTIRAYYKAYSPTLTTSDYEDFSGPPYFSFDPQSPMEAKVELETKKDIYALHLTNIYYTQIMRLKGQAVPIHFVNRAPDKLTCRELPPVTDEIFEETTTTTPQRQDLPPYVNLLVYNRDLGTARASNGFQVLSNANDCHNIPNGNMYLRIPIFAAKGHGENLALYLTYNSLQASYQDSLDLVRVLNGASDQQIRDYYCENPLGKGWTHNYNIYLKEYVKPVDRDGRVLRRYMELVCPDGNRIQFMEKMGETTSDESSGSASSTPQFLHEFTSDHWCGSAEIGHSLVLTEQLNAQGEKEHRLDEVHGRQYQFNKQGKLTAITNKLILNSSALKALRVEHGAVVKFTDSRDRVLEIPGLGTQPVSATFIIIKHPDNATTNLNIDYGRLKGIAVASFGQNWTIEYHDRMGEVFPTGAPAGSFIRSVKDPRDITSQYEYYNGDWFHQVDQRVARDFWGRFGRMVKGSGQDAREHLVRYRAFNILTQEIVYRNPAKVEFVTAFRYKEMAVTQTGYVQQMKDPVSMKLLGVPNYEQVLAAGGNTIQSKKISEFEYYNETKLVKEKKDLYENGSRFEYKSLNDGALYLLEKTILPDNTELKIEYNAANVIEKEYNPGSTTLFTEYKYDNRNLLLERKHPLLEGATTPVTETWVYDDNTAQLKDYTDREGTKWTQKYNEAQRDQFNTGLPTSRSVDKTKEPTQQGTLTWESEYDKMGNELKTYDPLFGTETIMEFYSSGAIFKIKHQAIETYDGRTQAAEITHFYDGLLNPTSVFYPSGNESWQYNDHGELKSHTDLLGKTISYEYHGDGAEKMVTEPGGITTNESDELGRLVRINYPAPDNRTSDVVSEKFTDIFAYEDDQKKITENRYKINQVGDSHLLPTSLLVSTVTKQFEKGRIVSETEAHGTSILKKEYEYNQWGEMKSVKQYDINTLKETHTIVVDNWARTTTEILTSGSFTQEVHHRLDNNDETIETTYPEFFASSGTQRPKTKTVFDELGRIIEVKNSLDHIILKNIFQDFGNNDIPTALAGRTTKKIEIGQDPSKPAGQGGLITLSELIFNRRGMCTVKYAGTSGSLNKKEIKYDGAGAVRVEIDLNGTEVSIIPNPAGKPRAITTSRPVRASAVTWAQFNRNNPAHTIINTSDVFIDYDVNGEITVQRSPLGQETNIYDGFGRIIEMHRRDGIVEQMAYDALGRMIKKKVGNTVTCEFTYLDNTRQVRAHYRNRHTETQLLYGFDWDHKLRSYKYEKNRGAGLGMFGEGFHIDYVYADSGKLESRTLFNSNNQPLSKMEYVYNAAGLRESDTVRLTPSTGISYTNTTRYDYDSAFRLSKIKGGIYNTFMFEYNHGGILKKLGRPMFGVADAMANATVFDHDEKGQLISMVEHSGSEAQARVVSTTNYYYQTRPSETWEQPLLWTVQNKDLLAAHNPTVRGWKYHRNFAQNAAAGNTLDMCVQDIVYDSSGRVTGSTSQFKSVPSVLTDNRFEVLNHALTYLNSYRHYREYPYDGGNPYYTGNFEVSEQSVFGSPSTVFRREGKRPIVVPKIQPAGYVETMEHYGPDSLLYRKQHVQEDINVPGNDLNSQQVQNDRTYYHDAIGRLVYLAERTDIRTTTDGIDPQSENDIPIANRSFPFGTSFLYGPEGEEVYRVTKGNGITGGEVFGVTVYDHAAKVAEYDSESRITRHYQVIPGLNTVLSALSFDDHGGSTSTNYHRWNLQGATLFLSNFEGNVVTDFQMSAPDGSRDLFGKTIGPGGVSRPETDRQRLKELWNFYQPSGPRTDLLVSQSYQLEQRGERIITEGINPVMSQGGRNNYGFAIAHPHIWTTQSLESSTPLTIAQGVVDFVRGMGDTISFGLSKYLREKIHGESGEVLTPGAYIGGMVAGIGVSFMLGYGVSSLQKAGLAAGWGYRSAQAYMIGGGIIGVAQSGYNIAKGDLHPLNFLGLIPFLGLLSARNREAFKMLGKSYLYGLKRVHRMRVANMKGGVMLRLDPTLGLVDLAETMYDINRFAYIRLQTYRKRLFHEVAGSEGHHGFFKYLLDAIARSNTPAGERLRANGNALLRRMRDEQRLAPLGIGTHQDLHYVFDTMYPQLARARGCAAPIARMINRGEYTPTGLLNLLRSFHRIVLKDETEMLVIVEDALNFVSTNAHI